jgi:type II secretory pathway pseudopilin PulG
MRRAPREEGFTIIEMLVAALILTIGALTAFGLLTAAAKNTQRGKATQVALDRAQQELEILRSLSNEELAMKDIPSHIPNPLEPSYRVSGDRFALTREPVRDYATMVVDGDRLDTGGFVEGGVIDPGPIPFSSGDVSGKIFRYVVWRNDERCGTACPRTQDYKQIIVAVKLDKPPSEAAERGYVEVQSNFVDPTDSAVKDPPPNEGDAVTGQQFYLSDTPCAASGRTERQPIAGDHLLHNTLGTCANGLQNDTTAGAPDALLLSSPPDDAPEDPSDPPLYDYSDDFYLEPTPDTDRGLQIRRDDSTGCNYVPTGSTHPESQVHRWVTDPMPTGGFPMTGDATLQFYSRTLNDALYTGTLCVYLYKRREVLGPSGPTATDTLLTNTSGGTPYWTFTPKSDSGYWPRGAWTTLRLKMTFNEAPLTIRAGERLGIALSVERGNTPADAIPIMYDHPLYATRIEVDTTRPIEGG